MHHGVGFIGMTVGVAEAPHCGKARRAQGGEIATIAAGGGHGGGPFNPAAARG